MKMNASQMDSEKLAQLQDRLFPFAYHLLGSAEEARDVVSEALTLYLEKQKAGSIDHIDNAEAYIFGMVRNTALNALKKSKRLEYPGPWLPEPIFLEAHKVENSVDCSFAMAILLGKLSPQERAVFLMKECFGFDHREIAQQFDLTEENCRKLLQRSRKKIGGEGNWKNQSDSVEKGQLLQSFLGAAQTGDLEQLQSLLRDDIVIYSDGGGKAKAALKPVVGQLHCFKFIVGLLGKNSQAEEPQEFHPVFLNNEIYVLIIKAGQADSFVSFDIVDGSLAAIYIQRNPDKLKNLEKFVTK
jgi:RNA polymerase sigma-70 factor (ECF subfamily)